jgi:O-antigen/teichoic acid export membrane protein
VTSTSLVGRTRTFVSGPGGIAIGTAVMNVCTFGFTLAAAGILDTQSYGAFFALLNLLMVVAVVQMGLQATAARRIVADPAAVADIERTILRVTTRTSLALGAALVVLSPVVTWLLQLDSVWPALLLAALAVPTTAMGGQIGILQGEKRWSGLSWMYVLSGVPRILALPLVWWFPTDLSALAASGMGFVAPVVLGWWLLRHPRTPTHPSHEAVDSHDEWSIFRESMHGTQALLAFFALANVDIIVARHVLGAHESGLYALGLIITKMMLFLPQFVIIVMFPSLATARQRRRAVLLGTAAIAALGTLATLAVAVLAPVAADLLDAPDLDEVQGYLWLFAVLGTLLSVTQLMVYAVLARRGRRSTYLVWAALVAAVVLGSLTATMGQLLAVMISVLLVLSGVLFVLSLWVDAERRAPAQ